MLNLDDATQEEDVVASNDNHHEEEETTTVEDTSVATYEDVSLDTIHAKPEEKMVPLAKYMEEKKLRQRLESQLSDTSSDSLTNEDFTELANEYETDVNFIKKLASKIEKATLQKVSETVNPILAEKKQAELDRNFEVSYEQAVASKYGDQINKKLFKKLVFDKDNAYLKTFDGIIGEYFPNVTPINTKKTEPKTETVEGGSTGSVKSESVDFANLSEEQYEKVMSNPKTREKYYSWKDEQ